jgi:peptide/nickel transport system substrate-binding protein
MARDICTNSRFEGRRRVPICAPWLVAVLTALLIAACQAYRVRPNVLTIGLDEEPRSLNIWLGGDGNSAKVLSQIYEPLYIMEPDKLDYVPWLASQMPSFDAARLAYTVKLRQARWSDGVALTAEDVAFTGRLIMEFKIPRYASKWAVVKRIEVADPRTVIFFLKEPSATFLSGTLVTPIIAQHMWAGRAAAARHSAKPLANLLNTRIDRPVGCGPFMLKTWRRGAFIYMEKNPTFFAAGLTIAGRLLGPHVDGLLFKIYGTSDVAVLALRKGDIDMFWWGIQPGYVDRLNRQKGIRVITSERSALYFLGFNTRRPPFNDVRLRQAVALLVDKSFIVDRILQGSGSRLDTIIPSSNVFWSNPNVRPSDSNMTRAQRIRAAYHLLSQAGYRWETPPVDSQGGVVSASTLIMPDGREMPDITILTPPADYDPHRAMSGMMIQEWLRAVGMPVRARPMAFGALLQKIKARHDFDAFVLGYGRLPLDPEYLGTFFLSRNARPRGWNISGYSNPEFDRLADFAQYEMDPQKRRQAVWRMQQIIGRDVPYLPLYNPGLIEAVRTDRFTGWTSMVEGIGNRWSFCQVRPVAGGRS